MIVENDANINENANIAGTPLPEAEPVEIPPAAPEIVQEEPEVEETSVEPESVEEVVVEEEVTPEPAKKGPQVNTDMDDLFEVPEEDDDDIYSEDLLELDNERDVMGGNMDDLFSVKEEDIMGRKPQPKTIKRIRRVRRPSGNQPTSMGGMSY